MFLNKIFNKVLNKLKGFKKLKEFCLIKYLEKNTKKINNNPNINPLRICWLEILGDKLINDIWLSSFILLLKLLWL